jgi:hypothetical protein
MSLLPYKYSIEKQNFANFLDKKSTDTYRELDNSPLTCKAELLPHLAVASNVSIDGMLEREARAYLANVKDIYNIKGTPQSILNALATIGLHTPESPAKVVEYRDISNDYTTERKYDGSRKYDGTWKFEGTTIELNFTLEKWYHFGVIINVPTTRKRLKIARRLINDNKPTRCELKALVTSEARTYDGTWKFNGEYLFDGSWIKKESEVA